MFIIQGILVGVFATILFDLYQISLSYAYNINKSRWDYMGRYFTGVLKGRYICKDLMNDPKIKYELIIGYFFHYLIGSLFGLIYILINMIFYNDPSWILALIVGLITVLGGWCIIMPFALNIGFFATKKDEQKQILVQNLIAHFIFGVGLFFGYSLVY